MRPCALTTLVAAMACGCAGIGPVTACYGSRLAVFTEPEERVRSPSP